ncbi:MAG: hypothetical protein E7477_02425 [Ruminococcaceae bacterium]|nr:hypothetical protein [Oscillospiraceae bacterium]
MKLFAHAYYKKFKCIADKCKHSCCIGWEIDIDDDTLDLYAEEERAYGEVIRNSIDFDDIPHFRLTDKGKCPHLDDSGLCKIINEFGEGHLCDICTDHPRFYEDTIIGKIVGIGMCCEEACRLILTSEDNRIVEIGEIEDESNLPFPEDDPINDEDELNYLGDIEFIIELLEAGKDLNFINKIKKITDTFGFNDFYSNRDTWLRILDRLEFLNNDNRKLFEAYRGEPTVSQCLELPLERILTYFIYRHCIGAKGDADFCSGITFSIICSVLIASIAEHTDAKDIDGLIDIARTVSEEIEYSESNTEIIKDLYDFSNAVI